MSITPLDIESKEFAKSIRGYNVDEVDSFLEKILQAYEKNYQENQKQKNSISMLEEKLETYKKLEENIKATLVIAQKTAEELKQTLVLFRIPLVLFLLENLLEVLWQQLAYLFQSAPKHI